jgi:type III restriction enzyme
MTEPTPSSFEVPTPILNAPFEEPAEHWLIRFGEVPTRMKGRRKAGYWYRSPDAGDGEERVTGEWQDLPLVNLIRERVREWRNEGRPGVTRTTRELFTWWEREGREQRLFFAQREAAEAMIFLVEARADFLQGIDVPPDEPSLERQAEGFKTFRRLGAKMATGSGKTTVMGMLAAWSILNKVANRSDARFSDTIVVVCPNVTILNRLSELDPLRGAASLYRTRDLVPERLMPDLTQGRVIIVNWHVFEPQAVNVGGTAAKVARAGVEVRTRETIKVAAKTTTMRGSRYITLADLEKQTAAGIITVLEEVRDTDGSLKEVKVEAVRFVESDTALLNRMLGREVGSKGNILVFNDEAHHAYRIRNAREQDEGEDQPEDDDGDVDEYFVREATVWVDGLDKIHKHRGINLCIDLSATPYYIARVGNATNTIFPWVVSDFGLTDAIESGLVKIPQLAVRDSSGAEIPGYFNIWRWILPKLTTAERGGRRTNPKPEAILKWADTPIRMLGGLWDEERRRWASERSSDPRPPVYIIICKTTKIAKVVFEWIAEDKAPAGIPPAMISELRNRDGKTVTIRVDTKVVEDTDTGAARSDEMAWMRFTLDTVGRIDWSRDGQGRAIYPENFENLSIKLGRPLHPPGRDIRCIVSVGMLTEGWDCSTVTHIVGLRPFMSQLLCEQVVGRGLRRTNYNDFDQEGKLTEEVAKVFGVPFEVIPFKESGGGGGGPRPKRFHVHAVPEKAAFQIVFPRVDGYQQRVVNRLTVDWENLAPLRLDHKRIPPVVDVKHLLPAASGRQTLSGPGKIETVSLEAFRSQRRIQELAFHLARDLTRNYQDKRPGSAPVHALFPQVLKIVERYVAEKIIEDPPAQRIDCFLSPYYGWVMERLVNAIKPDASAGETAELPVVEKGDRETGSSSDVSFWTSRDVREVVKCHVNFMVADTEKWEQSAAYLIDSHKATGAFVKNAGLGFAIPYLDNGEPHDYEPDFIIRMNGSGAPYLILEIKGYDHLAEVKQQAAARWVSAVNEAGRYGKWQFAMCRNVGEVKRVLDTCCKDQEAHQAAHFER